MLSEVRKKKGQPAIVEIIWEETVLENSLTPKEKK